MSRLTYCTHLNTSHVLKSTAEDNVFFNFIITNFIYSVTAYYNNC